ncbi:MAG: glycoside hydrolase family 130 protein [Cyclobacteriaceae bacterium]
MIRSAIYVPLSKVFPNSIYKYIRPLKAGFFIVLMVPFFVSCIHSVEPGSFTKADAANPVLKPGDGIFVCPVTNDSVAWETKDVFNPAAVVKDDKVWLFYRAEDSVGRFNGTSRIGLAVSADGFNFQRRPTPVLYPEHDEMLEFEWEGGIEDPRIVNSPAGGYIMTYTAYDGKTARLCIAFSDDLIKWRKGGTVLRNEFRNLWSKSGAIVAERKGEIMVAKKIMNKYWMYFGDTDLFMAWSEDLTNWHPLEKDGKLIPVLTPRPGKFDSRLVESGPYALWNSNRILLLYNGMNLDPGGDPDLPAGAYCSGKAYFDPNNPAILIGRDDQYFLKPDKPYEIEGQVNQVCFIEGLVYFKDRWFLYYGTADSKIAVAVSDTNKN